MVSNSPQNGPRNWGTVQALGEDAIAAGRRLYVEGAVVPRSGGSAGNERLREGLEGYTDIPNSFDLGHNVYMVFYMVVHTFKLSWCTEYIK